MLNRQLGLALIYSQLGRYEVKKAERERENNEAMKKKQLDILQSKGFKAHL